MESFVVQIHRRSAVPGEAAVVGIVEVVETGRRRTFNGRSELLALLGLDRRRAPRTQAQAQEEKRS